MKSRVAAMFITALLTACGGSEPNHERYDNAEQRYSVAQPEGWTPSIVRGSAQFTSRAGAALKKHTIVVRAAEMPREITEGKSTTRDDVVAATARVLNAMPRARVGEGQVVASTELPATRFSLTFLPRGFKETYRREHVVLVGSKRLYHVIYTAPAGESIDEAAFKTMVTTLTEGV